MHVLAGAVTGAFHQVLWGRGSEGADLVEMIDRALTVLEHPGAVGMRQADTGPSDG